jgi:putative peptidoglycan lipid II flippase
MAHGFLRNTTIVGLLTLLSRISGVIRDMVYLITFGAGPLMDAFLIAFKIPNFMRRLTAEARSPRPSCRSSPNTRCSGPTRRSAS